MSLIVDELPDGSGAAPTGLVAKLSPAKLSKDALRLFRGQCTHFRGGIGILSPELPWSAATGIAALALERGRK